MNLVDRAAALALRLAPKRFAVFPEGLGEGDLDALVAGIPEPSSPIEPIELEFRQTAELDGLVRSVAEFPSPSERHLPEGARIGYVERTAPRNGFERVVVLLQMWGDEGLAQRRRLADRLAERGIATVLPVHPFYGRRRAHAEGAPVRTVEEFLRMGLGAIEEVRSILDRLRRDHVVGLGGFSMGSGFSVGASTTLPFPVALTLMGAAPSPALAFTEGVLEGGLPESLRGVDKPRLAAALDSVSALRRPVLEHHRRAVILAARRDGFVPLEDATALADHWQGAELRLVGGGHATLWFFKVAEMVAAIERSFERHEA